MSPRVMAQGFGIDLAGALLASLLLYSAAGGCCRGYFSRVGFVAGLGVFLAVMGHGAYWNWMHFPVDYTLAFMIDNVVGWTLAGIVIAIFVRGPKPKEAGTAA